MWTSYANDPKDKARSTSEVSASAAAPAAVQRNASARVQEPAAAAFMGVPTSEDGRPLIELRWVGNDKWVNGTSTLFFDFQAGFVSLDGAQGIEDNHLVIRTK